MRARRSPPVIRAALLSLSTARGIARRNRRAATTWGFNRSPTVRPPDLSSSLPTAPKVAGVTSGESGPPEGTHPGAGRTVLASLPVPAGATAEQIALGERISHGEAADGTCAGCHGSDANGSPQGPSLVSVTFAGL